MLIGIHRVADRKPGRLWALGGASACLAWLVLLGSPSIGREATPSQGRNQDSIPSSDVRYAVGSAYPALAREARVEDTVSVFVRVVGGQVDSAWLESSHWEVLDREALKAACQWRFAGSLSNVTRKLVFRFRISPNPVQAADSLSVAFLPPYVCEVTAFPRRVIMRPTRVFRNWREARHH